MDDLRAKLTDKVKFVSLAPRLKCSWCGQSDQSRNWPAEVRLLWWWMVLSLHLIWCVQDLDVDFFAFRSQDSWTNWYWYSLR